MDDDAGYPDAVLVDGAAGPDARPDSVTSDAAPPPDAAPCVGGTDPLVGPAGECYLFFTDGSNWTNAGASCAALVPPAHLVSIGSAAENTLLQAQLGSAEWWIGFSDGGSEGTFSWSSGEATAFTNWRSGEPNNGNGDEDCAVIQGNQGGRWDDRL